MNVYNFSDMMELLRTVRPYHEEVWAWQKSLPVNLQMEHATADAPLSSTIASLNLAYLAVELSLHRYSIKFLIRSCTSDHIIDVCRSAALTCVTNAVIFVGHLQAKQVSGFWYNCKRTLPPRQH